MKGEYMSANMKYYQDSQLASSSTIAQKLFPHYEEKMGNIISYKEETSRGFQHMGIDRRIFARDKGSVKSFTVEEKIRRKFYNDFLLEVVSNNNREPDSVEGKGWIKKDLKCDLIAFYFLENNRFYLFNWKIFKLTYELNASQWIEKALNEEDGFSFKSTKNQKRNGEKYHTVNIVIPANILISKYKEVFKVLK